MSHYYSKALLRALRNDIPISQLIADILKVSYKVSEGYFRFLCPLCREFNTATNPETNLARCFRCRENFNPIDFVMVEQHCSFTDAVEFLLKHCGLQSSVEKGSP